MDRGNITCVTASVMRMNLLVVSLFILCQFKQHIYSIINNQIYFVSVTLKCISIYRPYDYQPLNIHAYFKEVSFLTLFENHKLK